jgi:hypothetical protein
LKKTWDAVSEEEDNDEGSEDASGDGMVLPVVEAQMRTSSRFQKRSKLLDSYGVDL